MSAFIGLPCVGDTPVVTQGTGITPEEDTQRSHQDTTEQDAEEGADEARTSPPTAPTTTTGTTTHVTNSPPHPSSDCVVIIDGNARVMQPDDGCGGVYITNPTTVIREVVKETVRESSGSGSSIDTSNFVTKDLFYRQTDSTQDSISDSTSNLSDDLSESVETDLLTVSGNGTLTGTLSAYNYVTTPYINATSTTATSTFRGALTVSTSTAHEALTLDGAAYLAQTAAPNTTTNRLYNTGGDLYWAGSIVGGSSVGTWTTDGTHVWRASGNVGVGTSTPTALFSLGSSGSGFRINTSGIVQEGVWNGTAIDFSDYTNATTGTGITFNDDEIAYTGAISDNADVDTTSAASSNILMYDGTNWTAQATSTEMLQDLVTLSGNNYLSLSGQEITAGDIDLTSHVTGTISVTRGGTGQTSHTAGQLLYGAGTSALKSVATTTATIGGGLSYSGTFGSLVGGANGTLTVDDVDTLSTGLTAGSVVFSDGSTLSEDSAHFIWDDANDRLGIGTTSPYATLSVVGETVSEYFTATSTTATSTIAGGFNVATGGLTYDFSTTNVGIGTQAPSQKLSVFETTANPQFRISYDASNYTDFTTSAAGALTITPSGDVITIPDDNLKVCSGGACQSDSTAGTGNLIVENDIETGGDYTRTCPSGYVWVPGNAKFGTNPGFCVMKYEAKDDGSGNAVSQAAGTPWVSISQENARAECQAIGPEYHLISEAEWMTIAEHIANLPINDMDADASIQLATGHTDNAPSNVLASDASADPATSGCSLTADMEDAANAYDAGNCEIRGTGSGGSTADDKGFYGTGEQWSATGYSSGGANKAQLRTHVLPNGEVLWDIAGNVWEWTDRISVAAEHPEEIGSVASEWLEYTAGIDFKGLAYLRPPDDGWSSSNGIGRIYTDVGDTSTAMRAFRRGGNWNSGSSAGVFALLLSHAPADTISSIGFRCAR